MTAIQLIHVPYDSGRRGVGMGAGPLAFAEGGLADTLRGFDCDVVESWVEADPGDPLRSAVDTAGATSHLVRAAMSAGRFPLVLAGNCITTVGAVAGVRATGGGATDLRVVWLDAHGDLNTPATSASGFLDGMAAAVLLGWCHTDAFGEVDGYAPLAQHRFMLAGGRDLDDAEAVAIARHGLVLLPPTTVMDEDGMMAAVDEFLTDGAGVWLHIDLDVMDPAEYAPANAFAPPGGLSHYQTIRVVLEIAERARVAGITLSAYDPALDPRGLLRAAALPFIVESLPRAGQ
jgi:arginase